MMRWKNSQDLAYSCTHGYDLVQQKQNQQREGRHGTKPQEIGHGLSSESPLLVESHGTRLIPPASNCAAQKHCQPRELTRERVSPQGFYGKAGRGLLKREVQTLSV